MDGILLIDKPNSWTSFDVIAKLRGALKQKRIGHAGTLDPMATGVLPILLGKSTALSDRLPDNQKRYIADVLLGTVTDTQDITGTVISTKSYQDVKLCDIQRELKDFIGDILQMPPMYSAISINGTRLYDLARQGIEVERKARPITIYSIDILSYDPQKGIVELDILCSKGTYVRTIANDIGQKLGCGATLCGLRRTMSSGFKIENSLTLERALELISQDNLQHYLVKNQDVFSCYDDLYVGEWQYGMLMNGVKLGLDKFGNPQQGNYRVWYQQEFLGIAVAEDERLVLKQL